MITTVFDYLKWRGDLTFKQDKMNIIDIFMLCQLPIIDLEEIVPKNDECITFKEVMDKYHEKKNGDRELGLIIPTQFLDLFDLMAKSNRFKDTKISNYFNKIDLEIQEQIAAITYHIENNILVCYSGTDDTVIGWKENFNMIFMDKIPSQIDAMNYSKMIYQKYKKKLVIAGHSKGGNMSLFGGLGVGSKNIKKIYCFDSPGVNEETASTKEYKDLLKKMSEIIPESSIVGKLFIHEEEQKVVRSNKEGFFQHDPLSWEVSGNDFAYIEKVSDDAISIELKIKSILSSMDSETKVRFADSIYKLFQETGALKLYELEGKGSLLVKAYFKLSKEDQKELRKPLLQLLKEKYFQKTLYKSVKEYMKK